MLDSCEFDFEQFNADKKVSSLDQFLSYMNKEDIFDSFPVIGNVIASDVVHAVLYIHSRDIVSRDIKPANVLISSSHYKSYKHEELEMAFGKKRIVCKLGDLVEARSMYSQTNALTSKKRTIVVHRGSLAFMVPELIIEELSIASAGIDELKTVEVWAVLIIFLTMLNPDPSYPFQNNLKNLPDEITSNMEAAFKPELQNQAYPSFSLKFKYYTLLQLNTYECTYHFSFYIFLKPLICSPLKLIDIPKNADLWRNFCFAALSKSHFCIGGLL